MNARRIGFALQAAVLFAVVSGGLPAGAAPPAARHLIYLHGRIVQEQQKARPHSPRFGYYELETIVATFRDRGFVVTSEIRPKTATESEAADHLVAQVRRLLADGLPPQRVTVLGASMGASITLLASVRLGNPDLRFAVLGPCLSESVPRLRATEGRPPSGRVLAVRETSDDLAGGPCAAWRDDDGSHAGLRAREVVLSTGLSHGFLYRPLPEWVEPVVEWATAP